MMQNPLAKKPFSQDTVIGLEIHAQLKTDSKLFCSCSTKSLDPKNDMPNTRTCPICLGHPGSKPFPNQAVIESGLRLALALGCEISNNVVFSRKSYFYPDMSKNFQITQFEEPIGKGGSITIENKSIGITRAHIEEDPAALIHSGSSVLVDYNRSGNPLMEIVTKPEIASPDEAREFMRRLLSILEYLEVYDNDWCILKADANVSIKESGYTRVEIKNITGFKEIERALEFEVARQRMDFSQGVKIIAETRGWDSERALTYSLREKESEEDYGYIIEPDLVPIPISKEQIDNARKSLPELSSQKVSRFIAMGVQPEDAKVIAADRQIAEFFEAVSKKSDAGLASRWIRRELMRVLNFAGKSLDQTKIQPIHMIDILELVKIKKITDSTAQRLMERLVEAPFDVKKAVESESLSKLSDDSLLRKACETAISQCKDAVSDYKKGEDKALNFIVGKVMSATKGKADPAVVKSILKEMLS